MSKLSRIKQHEIHARFRLTANRRTLLLQLGVLLLLGCSVAFINLAATAAAPQTNAVPVAAAHAPAKQTFDLIAEPEPQEVTVYVTRTGSKYHRASCQYLRKSKIPMSLKDAKQTFDACSVCNPPR